MRLATAAERKSALNWAVWKFGGLPRGKRFERTAQFATMGMY